MTGDNIIYEKKIRCFEGIEAEGPNRGKKVLFVPGTVDIEELKSILKKYKDCYDRLYYGAGNNRIIQNEVLIFLIKYIREHINIFRYLCLDIEVDNIEDVKKIRDYLDILDGDRFTIILFRNKYIKDEVQLDLPSKYTTFYKKFIIEDLIIWTDVKTGYGYVTNINDDYFNKDKYVEA